MINKTFIAVIGGRQCSEQEANLAEEVGREIARRGAILICGGMGGIMEAACKGASSEGGLTIGILPGESRQAANSYVSIPIITGMGSARNVILAKTAQAVIAIGGVYGTLSEIGHALQNGVPIIGLNTWSIACYGQTTNPIIAAENPADAVNKAFDLITHT